MELNDTSDYQQCFVCGQRNPYGLQMSFRQEGESVVADFRPKAEHQGFPGITHGGIVAAVLDEALNRTCALFQYPQAGQERIALLPPLLRNSTTGKTKKSSGDALKKSHWGC